MAGQDPEAAFARVGNWRLQATLYRLMIFRPAHPSDVESLVDVQQEGAVAGLGHIFPQQRHPFPRQAIVERWLREIGDTAIHVNVCTDHQGVIKGFAATRAEELLHFGTAYATWGSGLASELHDAVLATLPETSGVTAVRLWVFEANHRARRFYEKHGWRQTSRRTRTSFPPHPVLVEYVLAAKDRVS